MRPVIGANTYNQVARQLEQHEMPGPVVGAGATGTLAFPPMMGFPPPPPPPPPLPPPMLIPPQVARQGNYLQFFNVIMISNLFIFISSRFPHDLYENLKKIKNHRLRLKIENEKKKILLQDCRDSKEN